MKKILTIILLVLSLGIITGCGNSSVKEISFKELETSLKNKETFILEIVQDGCSNCESFSPKFEKILKNNNLQAKQINLSKLTEEDSNSLNNIYSTTGTPTVIFITKGSEESISKRIVGNVSSEKIISKLKTAGYIK